MNRRTLLKSAGATALTLSVAGCMGDTGGDGGNGTETPTDQGDEPIVPADPGWFDLEGSVLSEENAENLEVTQHSLYRTPEAFGVMGTIENTGDQPYVRVVAHARLQNDQGEIDAFEQLFDIDEDTQAFDDLAPGETLQFDIRFEDTDPSVFENESTQYEVWATGEVQEDNGGGNVTDGNTTA